MLLCVKTDTRKRDCCARVPPSVYECLEAEAVKLGWTVSNLARKILVDWVHHVKYGPPDEKDFPLFWSDAPPSDPPDLAFALVSWLQNPRIDIFLTPGEEVLQLRQQVKEFETRIDKLQIDLQRAQDLYGQECVINLELEDLLRMHGIRRRR